MKWLLVTILALTGCSAVPSPPPRPVGTATVVWISIDGFRHDYLGRIKPPTLSRLAREGALTTQERPIFPSLTFPNHIAQVTGTTVDHHGIPLNVFFDRETKQTYQFPNDGNLLRAEPIWITAKKAGLRVAVIDWPISYAQQGEYASDYFEQKFDGKIPDAQRLDHVADLLQSDHADKPLRLVLTYMSHVDTIGHRFGPESPEVAEAVNEADASIAKFQSAVINWFDATHKPEDELYLLISTDHGMIDVKTQANIDRLIGADLAQGTKTIHEGPVALVYFNDMSAEQKADRAAKIVAQLKKYPFVRSWKTADVPAELHFADPTRLGEVVALLAPGYSWTSQRTAATQPNAGRPRATHGYDPSVCPEVFGSAIVWRYRHPMGGRNLGPMDNTQWHATVARLLGIEPSSTSDRRAVELK